MSVYARDGIRAIAERCAVASIFVAAALWSAGASGLTQIDFVSDPGDYIGQGQTLTYTPADTGFSVSAVCNRLTIIVGNQTWNSDFQGMSGTVQLQPGYYGNLERYPFHNPAHGGLSWIGQGRGCNTLTRWFVVDGVTYTSGTLSAIDLRFEQHCEGGVPALHVQLHWTAGP